MDNNGVVQQWMMQPYNNSYYDDDHLLQVNNNNNNNNNNNGGMMGDSNEMNCQVFFNNVMNNISYDQFSLPPLPTSYDQVCYNNNVVQQWMMQPYNKYYYDDNHLQVNNNNNNNNGSMMGASEEMDSQVCYNNVTNNNNYDHFSSPSPPPPPPLSYDQRGYNNAANNNNYDQFSLSLSNDQVYYNNGVATTFFHNYSSPQLSLSDVDFAKRDEKRNDDIPGKGKGKAINFEILNIQIGSWEREARHKGDLIGRCYFKKQKLAWEILNGNCRNKIEFKLSNISAIKVDYTQPKKGTLHIKLDVPPLFFKKVEKKYTKNPKWEQCKDFTTNIQASLIREHQLVVPQKQLNKYYIQMISENSHLLEISRQPFSYGCDMQFSGVQSSNNLNVDNQYTPLLPEVPFQHHDSANEIGDNNDNSNGVRLINNNGGIIQPSSNTQSAPNIHLFLSNTEHNLLSNRIDQLLESRNTQSVPNSYLFLPNIEDNLFRVDNQHTPILPEVPFKHHHSANEIGDYNVNSNGAKIINDNGGIMQLSSNTQLAPDPHLFLPNTEPNLFKVDNQHTPIIPEVPFKLHHSANEIGDNNDSINGAKIQLSSNTQSAPSAHLFVPYIEDNLLSNSVDQLKLYCSRIVNDDDGDDVLHLGPLWSY